MPCNVRNYCAPPAAGNLDNHQEQDYQELVAAAVERHNTLNRPSLIINLPRTAPGTAAAAAAGQQKETDADSTVAVAVADLHRPSRTLPRKLLLDHAMCSQDQDNLVLLRRMRERMER